MKNFFRMAALLCAGILVATPATAEPVSLDRMQHIHGVAANPRPDGGFYVAAGSGLFLSDAAGRAQRVDSRFDTPASFVHVAPDGSIHAFVIDHGLVRNNGLDGKWETIFNGFGSQIPTQMMVDATRPQRLHLLTQDGRLLTSDDGGRSWGRFGRTGQPLSDEAKRGASLFQTHCQSCHGVEAVGETLSTRAMTDKSYKLAPALNGSAHAWHHTDAALLKTILEGSSQEGSRMKGFKGPLAEKDAEALIAYMKSLWGERELACQGPKHMRCPY